MTMEQDCKIIYIDGNEQDVNDFLELWKDETIEAIAFTNSFTALQKIKAAKEVYWIILVSEKAMPLKAVQLKEYLQDLQLKTAIIEVLEADTIDKEKSGIPHIYKPFTKIGKRVIEVFLDKKPLTYSESKKYGLGYLKEISQGNEKFVQEMLNAFMTMVKLKVNELETLATDLTDENIQTIKQVVHALKPSFEMVESYKGKELCHTIFYDTPKAEMALKINELIKEYESISTEIKKDYPDIILK